MATDGFYLGGVVDGKTGDHTGDPSIVELCVSLIAPLPSALITHMSALEVAVAVHVPEKAIFWSSGDHTGPPA